MVHPCDKPCGNKTASGYCATTACINPQYSNIGTAHYGQGVQKRIITNADRITSNVESLAKFIMEIADCAECEEMHGFRMCDAAANKACEDCWLEWLRQEVDNG